MTTPLVLRTFSIGTVQGLVLATSARIFRGTLIAEFDIFLCFWHLIKLPVLVFPVVSVETRPNKLTLIGAGLTSRFLASHWWFDQSLWPSFNTIHASKMIIGKQKFVCE
jgi:hypothetical protein